VVPHLPSNGQQKLNNLKEALEKQTVKFGELIIVDKEQCAYKNRNEGWRKAKGDIIWFLDADVVPDRKALEEALKIFDKRNPDAVEGRIYGTVQRIYKWGFMAGHIFYTKKILETIGGVDEDFCPGWRGDTDFGWCVMELGGRIIYCSDSNAEHPNKSLTRFNLKNEELLRRKHPKMYAEAKRNNYLGNML